MNPAHTLRLALRMLARDARAGELRVLLAALIIAVASVTSVGFFADRIGRALTLESHQLIGADFVVSSDRAVSAAFADQAVKRGLKITRAVNFPSMASASNGVLPAGAVEKTHLAGFKAVASGYPLRVNGALIGHYIADFVYWENDERVVEDCKGVKTPIYRIKCKLMKAIYGIEIKET